MAVTAVAWARRLRLGSTARKAVLLVLADRAKDNTWEVWVGQEALAVESEVSERTVRSVLGDLDRWGLIERTQRRRPDGYRTSDLIRLKVGAEVSPATTSPEVSSPEVSSPEVSSPEVSSPEAVAGSSDQGERPHRQPLPRKSQQTSPANERQPHRKQLPGNRNGKLEAGSRSGKSDARGDQPARRSLSDLAADDPGFERFWEAFPRRVKLKAARAAWRWALGHAPPDQITAAASAYAAWVARSGERERFVEEPAAWLARQGWTDDYAPNATRDLWDPATCLPNGGRVTSTAEALGLIVDDNGVLRAASAGPA